MSLMMTNYTPCTHKRYTSASGVATMTPGISARGDLTMGEMCNCIVRRDGLTFYLVCVLCGEIKGGGVNDRNV